MRNAIWSRSFAAGVSLLGLALASCYSFVGRYRGGPEFVEIAAAREGRWHHYIADLFGAPGAPAFRRSEIYLATDQELHRRLRVGECASQPDPGGVSLLRFGLLSDVHIREPAVKLFNDRMSRDLDRVIDSFERHPVQEAFSTAVYVATLKAFEALDPGERPRFLLHLGDATDAGTVTEAYQFVAASRGARFPFLNVIGNHDDAIFGNYKRWLGYTKDAGPDLYAVGGLEPFLIMHGPGSRIYDDLSPYDYPMARYGGAYDLDDTSTCTGKLPQLGKAAPGTSRCMGFDLPRGPLDYGVQDGKVRCERYPGYYAYTIKACPASPDQAANQSAANQAAPIDQIQLIVLDSTRKTSWGQWSAIDEVQLHWLRERLSETGPTVRLVFMHHRPEEKNEWSQRSMPALVALLKEKAADRPIVIFSGHDHRHATEWRKDLNAWELNTGSIEEYPQWARLVELRRKDGRYSLVARALRPRVGPEGIEGMPEADLDRQLAECRSLASLPALPDGTPRSRVDPQYLAKSAGCGYLASYKDLLHLRRQCHKHQRVAEASLEANVILDLSKQ